MKQKNKSISDSRQGEVGRGEYGECWRAVQMEDEYVLKSTPVQVVRRWPDGSERLGHTLREPVAEEFTNLAAAVKRAVALHDAGVLVMLDYLPDGRSGHTGGFRPIVKPSELVAIVKAARA